MGEALEPAAISDSGPLIHLHEIGLLDLLRAFDSLHVPQAVWEESTASGRVPAAILQGLQSIRRHNVSDQEIQRWVGAAIRDSLQRGELEGLALCGMLSVSLFLTDDLAARDAGKAMGIQPVGSLGIIVRRYHRGALSLAEAEAALEKLYAESTLFVTHAIVELAIDQLQEPK